MITDTIKSNNILVVGDLMLDSYLVGVVNRISPEAPVPVFLKRSQRSVVGGAANVVANLIAAEQKTMVSSVIGCDKDGDMLVNKLTLLGCDCSLLQRNENRMTTVKTRVLANNNQQLLRIDEEQNDYLTTIEENSIIEGIKSVIDKIDAIVISDYMKGVLTVNLCQRLIALSKENSVPVFIDIKDKNVEKYKGATLLKPNRKELSDVTGLPVSNKDEILVACKALANRTQCKYVLATLGSKGMGLYSNTDDSIVFIKNDAREVFDVSGAGDTVLSYLVSTYISGNTMLESAKIANIAAGIKVGKVGTATVSLKEVESKEIGKNGKAADESSKMSKMVTVSELSRILHNKPNKKVVFTNGCFDILHAGHVQYLAKASELGDLLIVGLNDDNSVRRLKGETRPINGLEDRALVLSGLESVSFVVPFSEDTPEQLIHMIKPDILVKGADYENKKVVGADFVKSYGGEVKLISFLENRSTTNIINKIGKNE